MIYNMTGGGGSLNFAVKQYATEAALLADAPKDGTLGVITSVPMTTWRMSFADSSSPIDGMVQIRLGTDSNIDFSASKKNYVRVCPLYAKVYSGGAWQDATLMGRKNGAWVTPWKIFVQGKQKVADVSLLRCVFDENGLNMSTSSSANTSRVANIVADLTNYKKIVINYYTNATSSYSALAFRAGIARIGDETTNTFVKLEEMKPGSVGTYEKTIDISDYVGEMVVKIFVQVNQVTRAVYINDWRLEP